MEQLSLLELRRNGQRMRMNVCCATLPHQFTTGAPAGRTAMSAGCAPDPRTTYANRSSQISHTSSCLCHGHHCCCIRQILHSAGPLRVPDTSAKAVAESFERTGRLMLRPCEYAKFYSLYGTTTVELEDECSKCCFFLIHHELSYTRVSYSQAAK